MEYLDSLTFVSTGICAGCMICQEDYNRNEEELDEAVSCGIVEDEGCFSWSPCENCNSVLGGNRYVAHGRDENDKIIHLNVCEDCLMDINS